MIEHAKVLGCERFEWPVDNSVEHDGLCLKFFDWL